METARKASSICYWIAFSIARKRLRSKSFGPFPTETRNRSSKMIGLSRIVTTKLTKEVLNITHNYQLINVLSLVQQRSRRRRACTQCPLDSRFALFCYETNYSNLQRHPKTIGPVAEYIPTSWFWESGKNRRRHFRLGVPGWVHKRGR